MFLWDGLHGASLLGWEREEERVGPQRVWNFTMWHLPKTKFTCRISYLLPLEKPPSKLLDNRMKQWDPDPSVVSFICLVVQSWVLSHNMPLTCHHKSVKGQSRNHVHFSDRETEDPREEVSCLSPWSQWRSQSRTLVSQSHCSVSYTLPGCRLHSRSYVVWPYDMSPTLEHERGSMNNYSETTTGNQDYLRNIWMNGLHHGAETEETSALHTAQPISFLWQETYIFILFVERSDFSVLRIEFNEQTQLGQVRRNQFSLFCATVSDQFGPQSS